MHIICNKIRIICSKIRVGVEGGQCRKFEGNLAVHVVGGGGWDSGGLCLFGMWGNLLNNKRRHYSSRSGGGGGGFSKGGGGIFHGYIIFT